MSETTLSGVLFVCLGNICRSPTAEGVFRARLADRVAAGGALPAMLPVDSCGTAGWHIGKSPDGRAMAAASARGYDLAPLRARQLQWQDFYTFEHILVMDESNLADVRDAAPLDYAGDIRLFLDYAPGQPVREVPDPYYGRDDGFAHVLDLVELASEGLLAELERRATR